MNLSSKLITLRDKVILQRTEFKATYNGKEIFGCADCGDNKEFKGILPYAPIHRCLAEISCDGSNPLILDPYNIPGWCPRRIMEDQK